jgi:hypothetical protein
MVSTGLPINNIASPVNTVSEGHEGNTIATGDEIKRLFTFLAMFFDFVHRMRLNSHFAPIIFIFASEAGARRLPEA